MRKTDWNEDAIREEFKRLDKKFGLNAAKLPIRLTKSKRVLGCFYSDRDGTPTSFSFSAMYMDISKFPPEEFLDTIHHEYAHYMALVLYGHTGHGQIWKKCCLQVGAQPSSCLDQEMLEYRKVKYEAEVKREEQCEDIQCGSRVEHPKYGTGKVVRVEGEGSKKHLFVDFGQLGEKRLSAAWAAEHCIVKNDLEDEKGISA